MERQTLEQSESDVYAALENCTSAFLLTLRVGGLGVEGGEVWAEEVVVGKWNKFCTQLSLGKTRPRASLPCDVCPVPKLLKKQVKMT
jgi:hypothetical protein